MAINVEQFLAQVDFRKSQIPILSFLGIVLSMKDPDLLMWYLKHCKIWPSCKKQFVTKDFCRWLCPTNVMAPHALKNVKEDFAMSQWNKDHNV